jgi:hypothetical protein
MNRPSIPVSDASNASQITQNGDALIKTRSKPRFGLVKLVNFAESAKAILLTDKSAKMSHGETLSLAGPPTGDETYLGGNAAYSVSCTNGCL